MLADSRVRRRLALQETPQQGNPLGRSRTPSPHLPINRCLRLLGFRRGCLRFLSLMTHPASRGAHLVLGSQSWICSSKSDIGERRRECGRQFVAGLSIRLVPARRASEIEIRARRLPLPVTRRVLFAIALWQELMYLPVEAKGEGTNSNATEPPRSAARHFRPADPSHFRSRAAARLGHIPVQSSDVQPSFAGRSEVFAFGAASARGPRLDSIALPRVGEQSPHERLQIDSPWPQA